MKVLVTWCLSLLEDVQIIWSLLLLWYSFGSILCHCIDGCIFCMLSYNFINFVFLLLCLRIPIAMYIQFYVFSFIVFVCKCVLYYCHRVPTQLKLTNIYHIVSYHIVSYLISYHTISYQSWHREQLLIYLWWFWALPHTVYDFCSQVSGVSFYDLSAYNARW